MTNRFICGICLKFLRSPTVVLPCCCQPGAVLLSVARPAERQTRATGDSGKHPGPCSVPPAGLHQGEGQSGAGTPQVMLTEGDKLRNSFQKLHFVFCFGLFPFVKKQEGRMSMTKLFAPYMKKWRAKLERKGTSGRTRYRHLTFDLRLY